LSSHDELRKTQQQSISEQKNYLLECIELAQHAILSKLTSNTVSESALDESISERENRLSTLVVQIQAQATAAILDRRIIKLRLRIAGVDRHFMLPLMGTL
jgi:multidrug efflux pump subunit AcrA (membrane-fusion protein)